MIGLQVRGRGKVVVGGGERGWANTISKRDLWIGCLYTKDRKKEEVKEILVDTSCESRLQKRSLRPIDPITTDV